MARKSRTSTNRDVDEYVLDRGLRTTRTIDYKAYEIQGLPIYMTTNYEDDVFQ